MIVTSIDQVIEDIDKRIAKCWMMAEMFLENLDDHGLHDSGVEIAALKRSKQELLKLREKLNEHDETTDPG